MLDLYNLAWEKKEIPKEWSNAIIHKRGDATICDNYRGISLMCVAAKVYEKIIEKRLRLEVEEKLQWEQSGFRRNHSTQDHLFTIQQLIEKSIRKNKQLYSYASSTSRRRLIQ